MEISKLTFSDFLAEGTRDSLTVTNLKGLIKSNEEAIETNKETPELVEFFKGKAEGLKLALDIVLKGN